MVFHICFIQRFFILSSYFVALLSICLSHTCKLGCLSLINILLTPFRVRRVTWLPFGLLIFLDVATLEGEFVKRWIHNVRESHIWMISVQFLRVILKWWQFVFFFYFEIHNFKTAFEWWHVSNDLSLSLSHTHHILSLTLLALSQNRFDNCTSVHKIFFFFQLFTFLSFFLLFIFSIGKNNQVTWPNCSLKKHVLLLMLYNWT